MRRYIRHPSDIPIDIEFQDSLKCQTDTLSNISLGGLSFHSNSCIDEGTPLLIKIPFGTPAFEAHCRVVWCKKLGQFFELGVELLDKNDAYRARMIEQVCHIEHYKREVLTEEGRELSGEQAAAEWIQKYAKDFPQIVALED